MLRITPLSKASYDKPVKLCANCKFAHHNHNQKPYNTECTLFYKMDLVHGRKYFDSAISCRTDKEKCGSEGKYYEGLTRSDTLLEYL